MKNLNKFTKAELINKLKYNNSNSKSFLDQILKFKSLILKITLISFIITWIKKYSLVTKLWHLFSLIGSTLLSISLFDIYSLEVINWIKETQIYKWFSSFILNSKTEVIDNDEFRSNERTSIETTTNEKRNDKNNRWMSRNIEQKEINIEEINKIESSNWPTYKHIFIITGVIVISGLSLYFSEEIKTGISTSFDWFKNLFSNSPRDPGTDSAESSLSPSTQENFKVLQSRLKKYFKLEKSSKNTISDIGLDNISDIELIDNNEPVEKLTSKILTSPSLESLNRHAEDAFQSEFIQGSSSSNIPGSPESNSSIETIKPSIAPIPDSYSQGYWKFDFKKAIRDKFNFIETIFSDDTSEEVLTKDVAEQLSDSLAELVKHYNNQVNYYQNNNLGYDVKQKLFCYKKWISEYHSKIVPLDEIIDVGTLHDEPTIITFNN